MHAWEDWAETWAHYLHMTDTLETAVGCGLSLRPQRSDEPALTPVSPPSSGRAASFDQTIDRINKDVASFETIKKFHIAEHPLSVENGLLTPSLKVKRKMVYERFKEHFEGLYDGEAAPRRQQVSA